MKRINAYLHFRGNCRQAMTFYNQCLGGDLVLLPVGDSPVANDFPGANKDHILHADLKINEFVLMADDQLAMSGDTIGSGMSLMLECSTEADVRTLFASLSEGGTMSHPLEDTFWNSLFGDVTDQFGVHWYLNFDKNAVA